MQSFPKCGPQTSVAQPWVLLFSFRWRRNLNSGRQESMLQGRQRGEDRIWLLRGQYYLVLSYVFLFLRYFHNIIDLFSALSLADSLRSPIVLSPGYQKPRAYLGWLWPPKKSRRLARSNPGLQVAQTFPFTTSSQLLSACVPVSFLWSCPIIPWSQPLTFLFFFTRSFLSQLQLFFSPFIYVATSPPRICLDFCQHSFLIFS